LKSNDDSQQNTLACAAAAKYGDSLASLYLKGDTIQYPLLAKGLGHILNYDRRLIRLCDVFLCLC
jgi:hypothetical protein